MQGAEAPQVDIAEAQPLDSFPRAVQEHIRERPSILQCSFRIPHKSYPAVQMMFWCSQLSHGYA